MDTHTYTKCNLREQFDHAPASLRLNFCLEHGCEGTSFYIIHFWWPWFWIIACKGILHLYTTPLGILLIMPPHHNMAMSSHTHTFMPQHFEVPHYGIACHHIMPWLNVPCHAMLCHSQTQQHIPWHNTAVYNTTCHASIQHIATCLNMPCFIMPQCYMSSCNMTGICMAWLHMAYCNASW